MHTLVILISFLIFSNMGQAKSPPPIAPQVEALKSVIARYQEQISKVTYVNNQIRNLAKTSCDFTNGKGATGVSTCVANIDRLVVEMGTLKRSVPFIQEIFREIPSAFNPIRSILENDLAGKNQWLKETSEKLKVKADELFAAAKQIINDSLDTQFKENESKARFEAICSSSRSNLKLHQRFANYFDSIHASYAQYERLRFQLAQTIWKMELIERKCPLINSEDVAQGNKLFLDLTTKVDANAFSKFKASICSLKIPPSISKDECLRLPQTPEAVAVLESIQDRSGGHK